MVHASYSDVRRSPQRLLVLHGAVKTMTVQYVAVGSNDLVLSTHPKTNFKDLGQIASHTLYKSKICETSLSFDTDASVAFNKCLACCLLVFALFVYTFQ